MRFPLFARTLFGAIAAVFSAFGNLSAQSVEKMENAALRTSLREIEETASSVEELIARKETLVHLMPIERPVRQSRAPSQISRELILQGLPSSEQKRASLALEVEEALKEMRLNGAGIEEQIRAAENFVRLNQDALAKKSFGDRIAPKKTLTSTKSPPPQTEREKLMKDAREALDEIRRKSKSPEQFIVNMESFMSINRDTLKWLSVSKKINQSAKP